MEHLRFFAFLVLVMMDDGMNRWWKNMFILRTVGLSDNHLRSI